jgi:hypothetical protein
MSDETARTCAKCGEPLTADARAAAILCASCVERLGAPYWDTRDVEPDGNGSARVVASAQ